MNDTAPLSPYSKFLRANPNNRCCEEIIWFGDRFFRTNARFKRFGYALSNDDSDQSANPLVAFHLIFETSATIPAQDLLNRIGRLFSPVVSVPEGFQLKHATVESAKCTYQYVPVDPETPHERGEFKRVRSRSKLVKGVRCHLVLEMSEAARKWLINSLQKTQPTNGPGETCWKGARLEIQGSALEYLCETNA